MNRNEFLGKLFKMYPLTFTPENISTWLTAYEQVLKPNWDYEKLFYKMVTNYQHTNIAPAPAYFYEFKRDVEIKIRTDKKKLIEYSPPTQEFLELKIKLQEKIQQKSNILKD